MGRSLNMLMISGALLALLGLAAFATPVFTTADTKDVAEIGGMRLQIQENTSHVISPAISGSALILGIMLFGAGFYRPH
jgi:hypothetical protein